MCLVILVHSILFYIRVWYKERRVILEFFNSLIHNLLAMGLANQWHIPNEHTLPVFLGIVLIYRKYIYIRQTIFIYVVDRSFIYWPNYKLEAFRCPSWKCVNYVYFRKLYKSFIFHHVLYVLHYLQGWVCEWVSCNGGACAMARPQSWNTKLRYDGKKRGAFPRAVALRRRRTEALSFARFLLTYLLTYHWVGLELSWAEGEREREREQDMDGEGEEKEKGN